MNNKLSVTPREIFALLALQGYNNAQLLKLAANQ